MAYRTYDTYGVACDQCGRETASQAAEADPTRQMADETAFDLGWEIIGRGDATRHCCPDHWRVACAGCGGRACGNVNDLERDGWLIDDDPLASRCPDCAGAANRTMAGDPASKAR